MKNWIVLLMPLVIIYWEIRFDIWQWRRGKNDKPISTYIRAFLFVAFALVAGLLLDGPYLLISVLAGLYFFATHYLLFNPWLNISRTPKKPLSHKKRGEWWYQKPLYIEYFVKVWLWYVSWLLVFHWEFVEGHYETNGTWWELFSQFITF